MRKLGRMVRRVLTAVSLLLFVAVLAAWVRGYWSWDQAAVIREEVNQSGWRWATLRIMWGGGNLCASLERWYADREQAEEAGLHDGTQWEGCFFQQPPERVTLAGVEGNTRWIWEHAGISLGVIEHSQELSSLQEERLLRDVYVHDYFLAFPCWMPAIVFGALPSWRGFVWWRGVRRRRLASREGRCPVCGYDLRASPQRCPECGTAVGGKGE